MIICVGAGEFHGLVPTSRLSAKFRAPVKFDEGRLAFSIQQSERVDAKPLHHPQRAGYAAIGHDPHDHVG